MLIDSNGKGGFHIRMLFYRPVLSCHALAFGTWLASDYANFGVQRPEVFPKQAFPTGKRIGSWLRLPGHHHTRDHWSRVWDGTTWLDGSAAVSYLLGSNRFTSGFELLPVTDSYIKKQASIRYQIPDIGPTVQKDNSVVS